jgi:hypothetical protein
MGSINQVYREGDRRWLHDNACLWRYVPLKTLLFYLTGNIFIPAINTLRLEDPFEGKFVFDTIWFNEVMHKRYGKRVEDRALVPNSLQNLISWTGMLGKTIPMEFLSNLNSCR